jgi:hypothetical protein
LLYWSFFVEQTTVSSLAALSLNRIHQHDEYRHKRLQKYDNAVNWLLIGNGPMWSKIIQNSFSAGRQTHPRNSRAPFKIVGQPYEVIMSIS